MDAMIRNTLAAVLVVLAVLGGGAAMLGAHAAALVDTPGPLQRILGPLATDPELAQLLPERLGEELSQQITAQSAVPQLAAGPLRRAVTTSVGALLDEPGFGTAWEDTIEASRADFTSRLDVAAGPGAEQVTVRLDIAPLLGSGYDALLASLQGSALGNLLPAEIQGPPVLLDTGWPQADQLATRTLNSWLTVARGWGWLAAGAVLAAVAGMLLGTRAGRPWLMLAGGGTALVLGAAARAWFTSLGASGAQTSVTELESLVTHRLLESLAGEFGSVTTTLLGCGIAALLLGAGWAWWHTRAPADRQEPDAGA
ncbi:hypothetical protein [Paeniglutamicibacter gangotriensis]|uniref:Uncharacterized protein n=1 Tax=Paeniglutamicibacter gangotriensis Lz1y TaxID=1276920 RepID=M7MXC2_9MICC|nr:hypothetical protein [Paeniglutamicibacter gangotriensis]EMQ99610.1 hypothetical protein ADIAG_00710 [Paeniglutamicibacter gangotriensis Lz1y]